jgi:probable O-glycosylation ligase (exosortase A-associated)
MRDFLVLAIILGSAPMAFMNPFYGIMVWYWIAYFNPHRLAYSIRFFPVAEVIAIPTILGLPFAKQLNKRIWTRETALLLFLFLWYGITLLHASLTPMMMGHVDTGFEKFVNVGKILLMTTITVMVLTTRDRIHWLMLTVALSFGLLAIKGSIFGLATGGGSRIYGPEGSFVADNNSLGLALDMSLAMFFFLAREEQRFYLKWILYLSFVCGILSVILTYSRGALLGMIFVLAYIAIRSKRKAITAILLVPVILGAVTFAPQAWWDRMDQFFHGHLDDSARERLITWHTGYNLSKSYPIFGGGLDCYSDPLVHLKFQSERLPNGELTTGPHSIYLQMLGEHGYPGLLLFLILIGSCFVTLRRVRKMAVLCPPLQWVNRYTYMLEGSILAFMISGTFLEFANFDLWYLIVGMVAAISLNAKFTFYLWQRELASESQPEETVATEALAHV